MAHRLASTFPGGAPTVLPTAEPLSAQLLLMAAAESPDPLPQVADSTTSDTPAWTWIYRRGDYERAILHRLVSRGFAANRFVHYAENYSRAASEVEFVWRGDATARPGSIRSDGRMRAFIGRAEVTLGETEDPSVKLLPPGDDLRLIVAADQGAPASIAVEAASAADAAGTWEARVSGSDDWEAVLPRSGGILPAHTSTIATTAVPLRTENGLFRAPAPLLGHVTILASSEPTILTGESESEVWGDPDLSETRHDLEQVSDGVWRSTHELGFAFLRVISGTVTEAFVEAVTPPVPARGAFLTSDPTLTRIWTHSAYTLRLCMQGLMVDGIKRDRMPWAGDQSLSTLANAFAFGEPTVSRDSIVALGDPSHGYVNGISDYSLWWVINSGFYLRYFGDDAHAAREAATVHRLMTDLASHVDDDLLFRPASQTDGFEDASEGSIFIDWGIDVESGRTYVPLQLLWFWALSSASALLNHAAHPGAAQWSSLAERVLRTLHERAWSESAHGWREYIDGPVSAAPHAHMLGVLSGATPSSELPAAAVRLRAHSRAGTPFMTSFMLRALASAGDVQTAVSQTRELWSTMLERGAGTFWEEFSETGVDDYAMYGRAFGKSLCHAWSSGPAALLPEMILGLRPTADGWSTFTIDPQLGELEWAAAVVPTQYGPIAVHVTPVETAVEVPAGCTAVLRGQAFVGPTYAVVPSLRRI